MIQLLFALISFAHAASAVKTPLALNWKPEAEFGGFYAAQIIGADKKHGLAFEIQPGGSGTPVVQMVAAGKVDYGIASADEVILARSHGADVVALFASYQTNPQAIMAHSDQHYKTLADVYASANPLAIQKGLPYALFLEKKFAGHLNAQIVPYLGGIENFLSNKKYSQQCFATGEPIVAQHKGVVVQTFLVAGEGYNPYTTVLITRGDVLAKHADQAKSVVAAVREGWREYLDHPEKTNARMSQLNPSIDAATLTESARVQKSMIELPNGGVGTMTVERWTDLRQQLVDLKLLDVGALKTDAQSYFRNM